MAKTWTIIILVQQCLPLECVLMIRLNHLLYSSSHFRFESFTIEPFADLRRRPGGNLEHTNQLNDENNISHSNNSRKSAFNERQDGQVKNYRVTIAFRNARNQSQGKLVKVLHTNCKIRILYPNPRLIGIKTG